MHEIAYVIGMLMVVLFVCFLLGQLIRWWICREVPQKCDDEKEQVHQRLADNAADHDKRKRKD